MLDDRGEQDDKDAMMNRDVKGDKMKHKIQGIESNSIAAELELAAGDFLLSVNGEPIIDIFDYRMAIAAEDLEILIEKPDGEQWLLEIEKDDHEDIGLIFDGMMSSRRACENKCIFCFIDQMPPDMRQTLYFKDDDYRLGYLDGNYITLTNMTEADIRRITTLRLSPVNISVHTTDPALRISMMGNKRAGEVLSFLDMLAEGGIAMNFQIVLCKGVNDGDALDKTIKNLAGFIPNAESLSVVPVGLTKHRDGLAELASFNAEDARAVINQIEGWQKRLFADRGVNFVHAADEFYVLAGQELPAYEQYEGFRQLENGVGMMRLFSEEFHEALADMCNESADKAVDIVTGMAAAGFMKKIAAELTAKFSGLKIQVHPIVNGTLGASVTVAGLICGRDIINQLAGKVLGDTLLIPKNSLRHGEDVFLDDVRAGDIAEALGVQVVIVENNGAALVQAILKQ